MLCVIQNTVIIMIFFLNIWHQKDSTSGKIKFAHLSKSSELSYAQMDWEMYQNWYWSSICTIYVGLLELKSVANSEILVANSLT